MTGRLPIRTGNCSVQLPGQGQYGLAPLENTPGELFPDAGYAPASFGTWHLGDIEGRQSTEQGTDEWFGTRNTADESGYRSYSLLSESGLPTPQIWDGDRVSPLTPVDDVNLRTRPLLVHVMRRLDHVRPEAAIPGLLPDTGEVPNPKVEYLEPQVAT